MTSHGKDAVRLCEHIIREAFGDVVCRIASVLLNRGRLNLPSIARLSGIRLPQASAALLILLQHNLVQSSGSSSVDSGAEEEYEFILEECVSRLRWGRILAMTESRLGAVGMEIVRLVMLYGKLSAGDIMKMMQVGSESARIKAAEEGLLQLVKGSMLQPASPVLQVLESDMIRRRFAMLKSAKTAERGSTMLSGPEIANLTAQATHEIREERDRERSIHRVLIQAPTKNKKKKKGEPDFELSLRPDIPLRVNYDRYAILIRDELVVKAAEDRWNKGAAEVVRAVLAASLDEESSILDTRTHREVGFNEIIDKIPAEMYPTLMAGLAGSTKKSTADIVKQYLNILAGEDQMLANGWNFLQREGATHPGYRVEIENVCVRLRASLLDEFVRQRLGNTAARVLAVVAKAQKASETTVRDCAMLPLKDARRILSDLQKLSIVETQEVPKTAAKMRTGLPASAEYHLWQVDLPRVYNAQITAIYKTLGNIMQRRTAEVEKRKNALQQEKAAQLEGKGRERLNEKNKEELEELDKIKQKLGAAEMRAELVAFVLRDLPGFPGKR